MNVIAPGPIDTHPSTALALIGRPKETATHPALPQVSDSSFVSGIEFYVDGGVAHI